MGRRQHLTCLYSLLVAGLLLADWSVRADNLLVNPGFESTPIFGAWTAQTTEGWSMNGATVFGSLIHSGANALWMQGLYGNGGAKPYYNMGAVQTFACYPGSTYSADAWFSQWVYYNGHIGGDNGNNSCLFTVDSDGVEDGWVEVQFLDAANHILADYKSVILSPIDATLPGPAGVTTLNVRNPSLSMVTNAQGNIYLTWIHCPVTNQFDVSTIGPNVDPATESVTNTVPSGILTAPPGSAYVKYFVGIAQALYESGASYWDDCTLNQLSGPSPSVIDNLAPNGQTFFYTNTSLTFKITSASTGGFPLPTNPQSGVKVVVNGVDQSANLQFSGTPTDWNVTLPGLTSNALYQVVITVVNSANLATTVNDNFDTLQPTVVILPENYDYTNGLFIQNPIPTTNTAPDSYWGTSGVLGVDLQSALNGGSAILPNYPFRNDSAPLAAWEIAPDAQLPLYLAVAATNSGVYNVDHNYNGAGNWFNYTKNPWPSGPQQAWLRCSGGNGVGRQGLNILTSGYGTPAQTTSALGEFDMPNVNLYNGPQASDWEKYYWVPLTDVNQNLIPLNIPAGRQTLQSIALDGGINPYVIAFVAFPSSGLPPTIANITPANGTPLAPASAGLTFTAGGGSGAVSSSGIGLTLNGLNVTSGLTFSGSGPIDVSYLHLVANTFYNAVINVTNSLGAVSTRIVNFQTMDSGNFYVKFDDFDYGGGQWDTAGNGLTPNAYIGQAGDNLPGIDYSHAATSGNPAYRFLGLASEACSDALLPGFTADANYDVGNFNNNDWGNYTRNYPAGKYYLYSRLAGYSGSVTVSQVTAGVCTSNQTLRALGTCITSSVNQGWQNWNWCVLQNNGEPAIVNVAGTNTLRVTSGGNCNANYFMLVPVQGITLTAAKSGSNVVISFPTQLGVNYSVYSKASAASGTWSLLTTVAGNGTVKSVSDPITATPRYYQVTSP